MTTSNNRLAVGLGAAATVAVLAFIGGRYSVNEEAPVQVIPAATSSEERGVVKVSEEALALMDIEARQDTDRLAYIYETYMAPMYGGIGRLLEYLIAEGRIREVPLRTFHFLIAHGAIAPFTLVPLAEHFDACSPMKPRAIQEHAELIADLIIAGVRTDAGTQVEAHQENI